LFAWNPAYGDATDHRNPDQWEFYVAAAILLPYGQRTISLSKIKALATPVALVSIGVTVDRIANGLSLAALFKLAHYRQA
jgi:hypothetical protein